MPAELTLALGLALDLPATVSNIARVTVVAVVAVLVGLVLILLRFVMLVVVIVVVALLDVYDVRHFYVHGSRCTGMIVDDRHDNISDFGICTHLEVDVGSSSAP
jgi:hypothetical protein